MNPEVLNVVYTCDENVTQLLGVSVYSLLDNFSSKKYKLKITVLDGGITDVSKNKLYAICEKFNADLTFEKIEKELFKDCPNEQPYDRSDVTVTSYFRLIIPNIFGEEIEKVIYIDCDTLIIGNIEELYETDIRDYYLGAVRDFVEAAVLQIDCKHYKDLKRYFNAGVLLINIKKMREDDIVKKSFDFIRDNIKELHFPDQDTLNYLCNNHWLVLDKGWNFQTDRNQVKVEPTPKILHYTTAYKPWHQLYHNYYQKEYMMYLKKAWPGYIIKPVPSIHIAIKQLIKFIPYSVPIARKIKKLLKGN